MENFDCAIVCYHVVNGNPIRKKCCMRLKFVDSASNDWLFGEDVLVTDESSYFSPPFSKSCSLDVSSMAVVLWALFPAVFLRTENLFGTFAAMIEASTMIQQAHVQQLMSKGLCVIEV